VSRPAPDRTELSDLVHRYAAAVDDRDLDAAVGLFTATAELILPNPPERLEPVRNHHGRDEIRAALAVVTSVGRTHHDIASEVYTADAATAQGRIAGSAHHFSRRAEEITDVVWYLRYDDDYVRTGSGWRIERRALTIDAIETRPIRRLR
jgi:3-phenylpropionate/cinnamic acid dioxygenase small subunit